MNGLSRGTTGVTLQSPTLSHDDVPARSPLPSPTQNIRIRRGFRGLTSTDATWLKLSPRLHSDPERLLEWQDFMTQWKVVVWGL